MRYFLDEAGRAAPGDGDRNTVSISLSDDREYAWLLVRSGTFTEMLVDVWKLVPAQSGSWLSWLIGYPLRLLLVGLFAVIMLVIGLGMVIIVFQLPVALFAFVHGLLPALLWQILLWTLWVIIILYLGMAVGLWLAGAAREGGKVPGALAELTKHVAPAPVDATAGWSPRQSLHIGHDSSRGTLFAAGFIMLGIVTQCLTVLAGTEAFSGPVETAWRWPLLFGEQLFQTILLGIPIGLVPELAGIAPISVTGRLLLSGVNIFYASGAIALMVMIFVPAFKPRELFKGTTRDLADYLENTDISAGAELMIHRVGVVRPLDESETVSLRKDEFLARIQGGGGDG